MNEIEIAGSCLGFFIESYDTTPNTLVSALYQLAKNPHIQDELALSIKESIAANNNEVTYDLIQKHEYLEKVSYGEDLIERQNKFSKKIIDETIPESLRCQPSFFGLLKICTKDYTMPLLPDQKIPMTIPAKTPILLNFATVLQ